MDMLQLGSFLLFSENPEALSEFYKKVFQKDPEWSEDGYFGYMVGSVMMTIGKHDKVTGKNEHPERVMFNFDSEDVKGEFERIKGLGATVIKEPYQPSEGENIWIATLADIDGNYFQLMTPWKEN